MRAGVPPIAHEHPGEGRAVRDRFPFALTALPVVPGAPYGEARDRDGAPLWPVTGDADRVLLARTAAAFGHALRAGEPSSCAGDAMPHSEVLSAGPEAAGPGALYAFLTNRRHRHLPVARAGDLSGETEVVVAAAGLIAYDLLEALYDPRRPGDAPGLIVGADEDELRRAVLIRSAAAALAPRPLKTITQFELQLPIAEEAEGHHLVIGRLADGARMAARFRDAGDLLVASSNSDGVDANFGAKILCTLSGSSGASSHARGPICLAAGVCHRLQLPLQQALQSDRLLAPTELAARAALLRLCFGFMPAGALYDYVASFLRPILANPALGVAMTSWETDFTSIGDSDDLIAALARGETAGEAVARFNRSDWAARTGDRLCLIGDPRFAFESRPELPPLPAPAPAVQAAPVRQPDPARARLDFLDEYLTAARAARPAGDDEDFARAAAALHMCRAAPPHEADAAAADMRTAMMTYLLAGGTMPSKIWLSFATPVQAARRAAACLCCGRRATRIEFVAELRDGPRRRLVNCPRCGIVEDAEADAPAVEWRQVPGEARFALPEGHGAWEAGLKIENAGGTGGQTVRQAGTGARRAHAFALPAPSPSAAFAGLFVLDGARLSVVRVPYRADGV